MPFFVPVIIQNEFPSEQQCIHAATQIGTKWNADFLNHL